MGLTPNPPFPGFPGLPRYKRATMGYPPTPADVGLADQEDVPPQFMGEEPPPVPEEQMPPVEDVPIGSQIELSDDEKTALKYIRDEAPRPDEQTRLRMTPIWQMYENYWRGLQDVIWSEENQAFLSAAGVLKRAGELEDTYIGSKIVNVYRSRGESIAAAVATGTPTVKFFPEDADDPRDLATAKAYSVASEYVADDNDSKLLHLRAIYTRWNQPFVAYYNTYVYDEKYGSVEKREYSTVDQTMSEGYCPSCGEELPVQTPNAICPDCGVEAQQTQYTQQVPTVTKRVKIPKGREVIEVYGPRHVKVPYNIKSLDQAGYLILETEQNWAQLVAIFPQLEGMVISGTNPQGLTADTARRDRRALEGMVPDEDQCTLQRCWFRTWEFNLIADEGIRASLRSKFPNGVQATWVDEHFVEAYSECMDEHWTLVPDPFAEHIHGDPLGKVMIPIQDMTNDTVQLTLETILFGIPDRYADPQTLDFKKYGKSEKSPGMTYPAKRPPGMGLDAGFFEGHAATLGDNVEVFRQALTQYGMEVTGDMPGIHGAPLQRGSSRTADEYRQAKQGALQRLSIIWLLINVAWTDVMKKAVNELRQNMVFQGEDIKFVQEAGKGFINVWIKLADIDEGKVGRARPEEAETFPISTEQQRGALLELIQTGIPEAFQWMFSPDNLGELSRVLIGLNRFKIPGEEDREYQLQEIHNLLSGVPAEVNPDLDNHQIHVAVIRSWASSDDGRKTQELNPQGYQMVMEHLQQHMIILQSLMAQQAPPPQQGGKPGKGGQAQESGAAEPAPSSEG
jgi:hypothetical protein